MEFLSLFIGGALTFIIEALKGLGWNIPPKTIIVILAAIGGGIALFLTPEQTTKIIAFATTGVASASGIYEYLKPFLKK